ncbi:MAG TPA: PHP-associated domain-containing protein, partial [bacterium]|nr:PHP-associated domain-containing protein [bacterium]
PTERCEDLLWQWLLLLQVARRAEGLTGGPVDTAPVADGWGLTCEPLAATAAAIHAQGGLAVLAHPLGSQPNPWRVLRDLAGSGIDAVETYNALAGWLPLVNAGAGWVARRAGLPGIAASDAHYAARYLGCGRITVDAATPEELVRRVRAGEFTAAGRPYFDAALARFFLRGRCLLCNGKLSFREAEKTRTCGTCGRMELSAIACRCGHYLCTDCWGRRFRAGKAGN